MLHLVARSNPRFQFHLASLPGQDAIPFTFIQVVNLNQHLNGSIKSSPRIPYSDGATHTE